MAGEILGGSVVAVATTSAALWLFEGLPAASGSAVPAAVAVFGSTVLLGVLGVLLWRPLWPRWGTAGAWVVLSGITALCLSAVLAGTRLFTGGLTGDQSFRTAYLTRLASSPRLADFVYADVPPFYPAGWFWLGARFAELTGIPPWAAFKPFALLTFAVTAVVPFTLWSRVTSRRMALLLALVTTLIGLNYSTIEPYAWPVSAVLPPLTVLTWRWLCRIRATGGSGGWLVPVAIGLALGVAGATYTLLFGFFAAVLAVLAVSTVWLAWRAGREVGAVTRTVLGASALASVIAIAVMLLVWAPYLGQIALGNHGDNVAARYLTSGFLPTPMVNAAVSGVLSLAGVVWIAARPDNRVAQALAIFTVTGYGWHLLSTLLLAAGTTLLPFRTNPTMLIALACAGLLGLRETLRFVPRTAVTSARRVSLVLGLIGLLVLAQTSLQARPTETSWAFTDHYPTGRTPAGDRDPAAPGAWIPELNETISDLTGRPPEHNVLLTDNSALMATTPYWGFQASGPHYANPAADFTGRNALIRSWAGLRDGTQLRAALERNPYRPPNVFVLRRAEHGFAIRLATDVFPRTDNVRWDDVTFDPEVFTDEGFARRDIGPYTVAVLR